MLPGALMVASAVFLALAMLKTKREKAELWKDSSLVLVFHGLERTGDDLAPVNKISQMEHGAKGVRVALEQTDAEK